MKAREKRRRRRARRVRRRDRAEKSAKLSAAFAALVRRFRGAGGVLPEGGMMLSDMVDFVAARERAPTCPGES